MLEPSLPGSSRWGLWREICRRLDGLPLAIELAAARVALLDRTSCWRGSTAPPPPRVRSRDAPARQRTLRATIEWSYELLEAEEQGLFPSLAVFTGGCTLEAAEAVCDAELSAVESLVVKSLVRRWGSGRLGMLDTIREYAVERLDAAPNADELYRRHAEHFLSVAEGANLNAGTLRPGGQRVDIALLEQDNLRAAFAWSLESDSIAVGLQIATALEQFWTLDDPNEGILWFERLFERSEAELVAPSLRAEALRAYGSRWALPGTLPLRRRCGFGASLSSRSSRTSTVRQSCCTASESARCGEETSCRRVSWSSRATDPQGVIAMCGVVPRPPNAWRDRAREG